MINIETMLMRRGQKKRISTTHYNQTLFLAAKLFFMLAVTGCPPLISVKGPPREFPKFPWPPPRASAMMNIPDEFLREHKESILLHDVDDKLKEALSNAGYVEKSYYAIPDGFAVVTRLEQINRDGTPKAEPDRWSVEVGPLRDFSLSAYLRALFTSPTGYFRVVVFTVTSHPFSQHAFQVSRREAINWLYEGFNRLPTYVGSLPYSDDHVCNALVYEFEKKREQETASALIPGRLSPTTHMERSGLLRGLRRK